KHALGVVGGNRAYRNDEITFAQIDATRPARRASHRPRVLLVEANRVTIMSRDEDAFRAVSQNHVEQLVAFVDIDGDNAVRADVLKISQRSLLDHAFARNHYHIATFREFLHRHDAG